MDHQFQKAGFDKKRLFYTQGDYGLFQMVSGRNGKTYDNEEWVMKAMEAQGFVKDDKGEFVFPADGKVTMTIPSSYDPEAVYACVNYRETYAPKQIAAQTICIDGDIGEILRLLSEE